MYSATKAGSERLCKAFIDEYKKPIVTIRPFSVYGPGEADFRFIPTVFRSCLTGSEMELSPDPIHDWIYIDDIISILITSTKDIDETKGTTINAGTGKGYSNIEIVEMIEEITGKKATYTIKESLRPFDSKTWVNGEVSRTTLSIQEGLRKYYESIK
jgi:nucleoside-diphosphate-sugar epimerase